MESFNQAARFRYNPNLRAMNEDDGESEESGVLEIYVHHARNIHNICIYDNQDVYAKFSLTYNPDKTHSTRIINGGGKNPEFNEKLVMKVEQLDAVLKCEIWMLSRARNFMEDQLLGFALVPISQIIGKGKVTQDYSLTSTDLFHSPAGTVQLSLSFNQSLPLNPSSSTPSISAEAVLLDRKISQVILDPIEYSRIEFPDMSVVRENQLMVSEYFDGLGSKAGSFLRLGTSPPLVDYGMSLNSFEENHGGSTSPNDSTIQNSGFFSSTTTSLSDDRNSSDSIDKKTTLLRGHSSNSLNASVTTEANHGSSTCPDTPTSKKGSNELLRAEKDPNFSSKDEESSNNIPENSVKFGQVFTSPLGNINMEAEQSAMQQQIVDMYMRSMQQFTESLAKMKLPMDLDKPGSENQGELIQSHSNNLEPEKNNKKKDGSRVFYGSRAFF